MSINVTVNGNPVRIKRGTMVTADSDCKTEMERRRKMRLAQVRQQSDEIATKVRQRVQKARKKEDKSNEKTNLDDWKLNRLLELQAQYCDSLRNLGLAHAQAIVEEAKDQVDKEFKEALIERSKLRGQEAAIKLHKEQEEKEKLKQKELEESRKRVPKESVKKVSKSPVRKKKKRKKCDKNESDNSEIDCCQDDNDEEYKDCLMKKCKQRGCKAAKILHKQQEEKEKQKQKEFEEKKLRSTTEAIRRNNKSPFRKRKNDDENESCSSGMEYSQDDQGDDQDIDIVIENDRVSPSLRDYLDKNKTNRSKSSKRNRRSQSSNSTGSRSPSPPKLADIIVHHSPDRRISPNRSKSPKTLRSKSPKTTQSSPIRSPSPLKLTNINIDHPLDTRSPVKDYLDKGTTSRCKSPKILRSRSPKTSKSSPIRSPSPPKLADIIIHHPPDTRISDRIKNRHLRFYTDTVLNQKNVYEQSSSDKDVPIKLMVSTGTLTEAEKDCPTCCSKCKCSKTIDNESSSRNIGTIIENDLIPLKIHTTKCDCCICTNKKLSITSSHVKKRSYSNEIPSKPLIVLKGTRSSKLDNNKAQYYDHKNRFSKEYQPPENQVQRISDYDIQILDQSDNEIDIEVINKRDKDAQIRGKKAFEKEKIQKDYKELMQKLPALQRQERMASLAVKNVNNPSFHMSENRIKQQELKKQCKMEDAFEKLFPHTITLKPKSRPDDEPFKVIDTVDETQAPPYRWDLNVEEKNGVVLTKDDGIITINPNVSDQTDNLKVMLEKLKQQKKMLMEEVETLPRDSNLDSIIDELENCRNKDGKSSDSEKKLQDDLKRSHKKKRKKTKKSHYHKVLQNMSTQTSPKVTIPIEHISKETEISDKESKKSLKKEVKESKSTVSDKSLSPSKLNQSEKSKNHDDKCHDTCCLCDKNDFCEIVIKIQDDVPQINIKSPKKSKIQSQTSLKQIASNVLSSNQNENVPRKKSVETILKPSEKKSRKIVLPVEKLDSKLSWSKSLMNTPGEPSTSTSYYSPPDFQKTISEIPPQKEVLLKYIKKLLTMSRKSVENLKGSGSSSLESTDSISNSSAASLALKLFESTLHNMEKQLNTSSTSSNSIKSYEYDASISISNNNANNQEDVDNNKLAVVAEKYQNMVDQCHKRISGLTAMIEKVRKEREQILSPNFSDKEPSTAYLTLPNSMGEENKSSTISENDESDKEQKLLNKLLLDVNINIDKLKEQAAQFDSRSRSSSPGKDIVDPEVYQRFKSLMNVEESDENVIRDMINESFNENKSPNEFVPMIDIPRLPKLRPHFSPYVEEIYYDKPKKPPPAKGLSAAKKFNGEITNIPHELSTIAEVDSQISTRISPQKQEVSKQVTSNQNKTVGAMKVDELPSAILPQNKSNPTTKETNISQESMPDIVVALKSGESSSSNVSDEREREREREKQRSDRSNSSDMENLETMLASMGMGWAIATLRKTQKALIQNGSTSSSEKIRKQYSISKNASDSSTSDITLRDYLGKKMFSTSSTYGSGSTSMSPFRRELEDISVIQGSAMSNEYKNVRTSTPVGVTNLSAVGQRRITTRIDGMSSNSDGGFVTLPNVSVDKSNTDGGFVTLPNASIDKSM